MVTVCPSQFATRRTLFHVLVGCGLLMLKVSRLKLPVIWLLVSLCFFFSSRRRHTRYIGDWSSDVCSSDLVVADRLDAGACADVVVEDEADRRRRSRQHRPVLGCDPGERRVCPRRSGEDETARSEERRVGKECK